MRWEKAIITQVHDLENSAGTGKYLRVGFFLREKGWKKEYKKLVKKYQMPIRTHTLYINYDNPSEYAEAYAHEYIQQINDATGTCCERTEEAEKDWLNKKVEIQPRKDESKSFSGKSVNAVRGTNNGN